MRPVISHILIHNVSQSHVCLLATVHGGGGIDLTVHVPHGPILKWSVKSRTSNGMLISFSP